MKCRSCSRPAKWRVIWADERDPFSNPTLECDIHAAGYNLPKVRLNEAPVVYLAGGINGLSDADARDWREHAKRLLRCETLDPMRRDYRGREDESVNEIVHGDLGDIHSSDIVLASCVRPSWGTAMEIHYASAVATKPVYAVVPEGQAVSPWLRYFAEEVFPTFDLAIERINALLFGNAHAELAI